MTRKNLTPPEGEPESALREALRTTTYLPPDWVYDNFKVSESERDPNPNPNPKEPTEPPSSAMHAHTVDFLVPFPHQAEVTDVEMTLSPTWSQLSDFLEARRDGMCVYLLR